MGKPFHEVFPSLKLSGEVTSLLSFATVRRITTNSGKDRMRVYLDAEKLIEKQYIYEIEQAIKDQLFFAMPIEIQIIEQFRLSGQYTARKLMPIYRESILLELKNYSRFLYN